MNRELVMLVVVDRDWSSMIDDKVGETLGIAAVRQLVTGNHNQQQRHQPAIFSALVVLQKRCFTFLLVVSEPKSLVRILKHRQHELKSVSILNHWLAVIHKLRFCCFLGMRWIYLGYPLKPLKNRGSTLHHQGIIVSHDTAMKCGSKFSSAEPQSSAFRWLKPCVVWILARVNGSMRGPSSNHEEFSINWTDDSWLRNGQLLSG